MIRFVTAQEMRALDEETIQKKGVPGAVLMESAGRGGGGGAGGPPVDVRDRRDGR